MRSILGFAWQISAIGIFWPVSSSKYFWRSWSARTISLRRILIFAIQWTTLISPTKSLNGQKQFSVSETQKLSFATTIILFFSRTILLNPSKMISGFLVFAPRINRRW